MRKFPGLVHYDNNARTLVETDGIKDIIARDSTDINMTPLIELNNLPKTVRSFIERLQPNSVGLFDKDGIVLIEVSLNILRSFQTFQAFLVFYHRLLSEFPSLTGYVELYENSEEAFWWPPNADIKLEKGKPIWIPRHFYISIAVVFAS